MKTGYELKAAYEDFSTSLQNSIFFDTNLTDTEKVIFCIITILNSKANNFCFATNEQIAQMCGKTEAAVKMCIKRLNEKQYILVDMLQNRTPFKRRIFTYERHYQMWRDGELPKDCIYQTAQRKVQELNIEELTRSFVKFKKFMRTTLTNQEFTSSGNSLFLAFKKIKIKDNGYYYSVSDGRDLYKDEAQEFERLMFDKAKEILEAYIKYEEVRK